MYSFVLTIATKDTSLWQPSVEMRKKRYIQNDSFLVKKYLEVSVFAQMTLATLGLSQTVGTTALVTQHPSVAGKTKQLQSHLSIRSMAQEGEACKKLI